MKRKMFVYALVLFVACTACAQQRANDPSDFNIVDHGTWIEITGYRGASTTVVIPERINGKPVTDIGEEAFFGGIDDDNGKPLGTITSITIPNSVTTIGRVAFAGNQLTSVTIPNSVTSIGKYAFAFNQLSSVTIGNSVNAIEQGTFLLNQLSNVTIPNSVAYIDDYAFDENPLTSATMSRRTLIDDGFPYTTRIIYRD